MQKHIEIGQQVELGGTSIQNKENQQTLKDLHEERMQNFQKFEKHVKTV